MSAAAPRHEIGGGRPAARKRPSSARRITRALLSLVAAVLAVVVGVMIFDRVVMPRVVRHGDDVRVPSVAGRDLAESESILRADGLQPMRAAGRHNSLVASGKVLEVSPSVGLLVKRGRQVFLTPSLGPINRKVPEIAGLSTRMARVELSEAGLHIKGTEYAATNLVDPDRILAVSPDAGASTPPDGAVFILVSRARAPAPYWLPDLRGMRGSEGARILESSGLHAVVTAGLSSGAPGTVIDQDPRPGTPVWPGATVSLAVAPGRFLSLPGRGPRG